MSILEICTYPDPVLREHCCEVVDVSDEEIQKLIDDMVETMYAAPGIGLAANQVGKPVQIVVIDLQRPELEHGLLVLVNPEIVSSEGSVSWEEGCLSVPDYFASVKRACTVTVRALDRNGKPIEVTGEGLMAVALQHEIDHLSGKLFIDRMGPIARDIFKRRWKKRLKEEVA